MRAFQHPLHMGARPRSHDLSSSGSPSSRVAGCRPLAKLGQNSQRSTTQGYVHVIVHRYVWVTLGLESGAAGAEVDAESGARISAGKCIPGRKGSLKASPALSPQARDYPSRQAGRAQSEAKYMATLRAVKLNFPGGTAQTKRARSPGGEPARGLTAEAASWTAGVIPLHPLREEWQSGCACSV
jgi:hypothetical protein